MERTPDAIGPAAAEVLPDNGRHGKGDRDNRQEHRLHHSRAYAETRLGRRAEPANDRVDHYDVDRHQRELRARRNTDPQHRPPNLQFRPPLRNAETQVAITFLKVNDRQNVGDQNGNERGQGGAGDTHFRERSDAENEQRCEDHVQNDAQDLQADRGFNDTSRAQSRT